MEDVEESNVGWVLMIFLFMHIFIHINGNWKESTKQKTSLHFVALNLSVDSWSGSWYARHSNSFFCSFSPENFALLMMKSLHITSAYK